MILILKCLLNRIDKGNARSEVNPLTQSSHFSDQEANYFIINITV